MVSITLSEDEAAMLRDLLEHSARDLQHEIHRTHDRSFKHLLRQKETMLDRLVAELGQVEANR